MNSPLSASRSRLIRLTKTDASPQIRHRAHLLIAVISQGSLAADEVLWINQDAVPHTVTASDGAFDSGTLDEGGPFAQTFDEAGTFDYVCAIHPTMSGVVTVTA